MQQGIPFKSWTPIYTNIIFHTENDQIQSKVSPSSSSSSCSLSSSSSSSSSLKNYSSHAVLENAVVMFARRGCCMGHVVSRLLLTHGVNPSVHEVGDEEDEANVLRELEKVVGIHRNDEERVNQLPVVFIGGRLFGGLDKVMAAHISGELVPVLKQAGALWL